MDIPLQLPPPKANQLYEKSRFWPKASANCLLIIYIDTYTYAK